MALVEAFQRTFLPHQAFLAGATPGTLLYAPAPFKPPFQPISRKSSLGLGIASGPRNGSAMGPWGASDVEHESPWHTAATQLFASSERGVDDGGRNALRGAIISGT